MTEAKCRCNHCVAQSIVDRIIAEALGKALPKERK